MKLLNRKNNKGKLEILVFSRGVKSKEEILQEGFDNGYSEVITTKVIEFILNYPNFHEGFPIEYSDDILLDYNIDHEDLGDFYSQTLKTMNIKVPSRPAQNTFFGDSEDYPVSLAIQFLEWCKTR